MKNWLKFILKPCNEKIDESLTRPSPIWEAHENSVFKLLYESPPLNGFDEMINLTNEGKIWKFPIDNEQGNFLFRPNQNLELILVAK